MSVDWFWTSSHGRTDYVHPKTPWIEETWNFGPMWQTKYASAVKFIYSEKATKFCEIFPLLLTTVHTVKSNPLLLTTVHTVKSKEKISQHFVAFSEYMNFIAKKPFHWICSLSTKHQTNLETPKPIIPWIRIWRVATGANFSDTFDPQLGILQLLNHAAPPCKIKTNKKD